MTYESPPHMLAWEHYKPPLTRLQKVGLRIFLKVIKPTIESLEDHAYDHPRDDLPARVTDHVNILRERQAWVELYGEKGLELAAKRSLGNSALLGSHHGTKELIKIIRTKPDTRRRRRVLGYMITEKNKLDHASDPE